ncbi:MAG: dihydrolipoyl dehydrogenase [Acidimicrobiaceae bacterium]|nr:dihydrolipoyl dehydrogenase [Acidimicrobiaceae bacterium]
MVVGEVASTVDLLVVGGGPGGYAAALHGARLGRSVTLVEREAVGGTCLNVGCIPSKALIEVADAHTVGQRVRSWGLETTSTVDMTGVRAHLSDLVAGLTDGVRGLLAQAGVVTVEGHARFTRPGRVSVERGDALELLDYRDAVVATGSRPIGLTEVPIDGDRIVESADLLFSDSLPERLVLVGGGYVGVELGCAFAKLGSEVTIVEAADRILPGFDARTSRQVATGLRDLGIGLCVGHYAVGLDDHGLRIQPADPEAGSDGSDLVTLPADRICVVVGRRPNSDTVAIERAGADVGADGLVVVDPTRRAADHLYAVGDLTAGPALAHKATAEAEVAVDAACGRPAAFDPTAIPLVVFSDPQVLSVGLDRDAAAAAGMDPTVARFPLGASGRARTQGRTEGTVTMVADAYGTVVGVQAVGAHVAELAGEAALAVETAATVEDLAGTIHAHPTLGEALMEAALGLAGRPVHGR